MASVVFAFFFLCSVCVAIAPKTALSIYETVGAKFAMSVCYEQIYKKEPNNENLYNLINHSIIVNDKDRIISYAEQIIHSPNYTDFMDEINSITRNGVPKDKLVYVYDVDSYITSAFVRALYNDGQKDYAKQQFYVRDMNRLNSNPYTVSTLTYVNCVFEDETMTEKEKYDHMHSYWYDEVLIEGVPISVCMENRLAYIDSLDEETEEGVIYNTYVQIKVNTCFYKVYTMLNNQEKKDYYEERITTLQQEYNDLINS